MIDKVKVLDLAIEALKGTSKYVVGLRVTGDNRIFVDIDGDEGINIDDCIELSRAIESNMNRDEEDFELNVSSCGADSPLRMPRQYKRRVGRLFSLTLADGREYEAVLEEADEQHAIFRTKGTKKTAPEYLDLTYDLIRKACEVIKF